MFLRNLAFWLFQQKTLKKWRQQTIPSAYKNEYKQLSPQIEKCYQQATHWHGTGRYHYRTEGQSKYQTVNTNEVTDVLTEVIADNGLKPHDDPWVKVNLQYASSLSTSQWRMYARIYAQLHQLPDEPLQVSFGDRKDIINFFFYYTLLSSPPIALWRGTKAATDKTRYATKGPIWAKTINNTIQSKGNAYADLLYIMGECTSNIPNNYGILFGINGKNKTEAQINPIIAMFESRFIEPILFNDITHIEVPYIHLEKTKALLRKNNITTPVFPLEICEMYTSGQPIQFFSNQNRLPQFHYEELVEHYKRSEQKTT